MYKECVLRREKKMNNNSSSNISGGDDSGSSGSTVASIQTAHDSRSFKAYTNILYYSIQRTNKVHIQTERHQKEGLI